MFEVLTILRLFMSAATSWRSALFLAILMAIIGPLQMSGNFYSNGYDSYLNESSLRSMFSQANNNQVIVLEGNGVQNTDITIDVLDTAPLTDLQMSVEPSVTPTQTGFIWDDDTIWSNADASNNNTLVKQNLITGSSDGIKWDFNSGLQGWTLSSNFC